MTARIQVHSIFASGNLLKGRWGGLGRSGAEPQTVVVVLLQYLLIAKAPLFRRSTHGDLSNFEQILTKYVNNHKIHVGNVQLRNFIIKKLLLHTVVKGL
jgi:hypothetical protein